METYEKIVEKICESYNIIFYSLIIMVIALLCINIPYRKKVKARKEKEKAEKLARIEYIKEKELKILKEKDL